MNTTGYYDPISAVRPILPGGSEAWRFELKHFQDKPAVREIKSYEEFAAMMDAATLNEDLRSLFLRRESESCDERDKPVNYGRLWAATHPVPLPRAEPCDERDDGVNKAVSEMDTRLLQVSFDPAFGDYTYELCIIGITHAIKWAHSDPRFLGITYKVGDTTTFSPGPYDESLGVPVAVHFKG